MKRLFGTLPNGQKVWEYRLRSTGIECSVLSWGAALRTLRVPDRDGRMRDVILGFDRLEDYLAQNSYLGASVGRFANRIGGASFVLDGVCYPLAKNDGENHLHGGLVGFDRQLWQEVSAAEDALTLTLVSPDGQEGYPGTLTVTLQVRLEASALHLDYSAVTDRPTLCNLTNHSYFNLNGHDAGDVLAHTVQIHADSYTESDATAIPTGWIAPLSGTPMDLRAPVKLAERIGSSFLPLRQARGFDHNYIPNGSGLREVARVFSAASGITMCVDSDQPGLQFYTGNYLAHLPAGKGGAVYPLRGGLCLETQGFPDAPHHPNFPRTELRPGDTYRNRTVFRFSHAET